MSKSVRINKKRAASSGYPFYTLEFITGSKPDPKHPLNTLMGNKLAQHGGGQLHPPAKGVVSDYTRGIAPVVFQIFFST